MNNLISINQIRISWPILDEDSIKTLSFFNKKYKG